LWKACQVLGISVRTYQRWGKDFHRGDRRRGAVRGKPKNSLSDTERMAVVVVATSPAYRDLPPSQIVPILAEVGLYIASESSFYRVLKQEKLLRHRENSRPRSSRRPQEYQATGPNQVWSWDITYLKSPITGKYFYLYLLMDVWSRKIVGWCVEERESDEYATPMIVRVCVQEGIERDSLVIHSDNGGPMKGATLLATLRFLGVVSSRGRPHVSDDNPYSEALFRTLKYRPEYPAGVFGSVEDARRWVEAFVSWYNNEHRHSGIRFVTPVSRHTGAEKQILANRRNPMRWTRGTRNWNAVEKVWLNPTLETRRREERESSEGAGSRESVLASL
jgi:putative transposase